MARVPVGAYVPGDTFFHRGHPFVKFYWVISFGIFCFYNKNPYINSVSYTHLTLPTNREV